MAHENKRQTPAAGKNAGQEKAKSLDDPQGSQGKQSQGGNRKIPNGRINGSLRRIGVREKHFAYRHCRQNACQKISYFLVAHEPVKSGAHDSIENKPCNTIIIDQTRREIWSPAKFLGLDKANDEDFFRK